MAEMVSSLLRRVSSTSATRSGRQTSKRGNKGADKRTTDKRATDKRATDKEGGKTVEPIQKYDPTKNNGLRPNSLPSNTSPAPNGVKATTPPARKDQLPAESVRGAQPPINKTNNKVQNTDISTSKNLDIDIRSANMNDAAKLEQSIKR